MSRVWTLLLRELRSQLTSPVAYAVAAGFLLLAGFFFFNLVSQFNMILSNYEMYAQVTQNPSLLERVSLNEVVIASLFRNVLVLFLFMMPVLTMRSFAEERKQGTDELLLTAPVRAGEVVAGKYLGLLALTFSLVSGCGVFVAVLLGYGDPEPGPVLTGFVGLLLCAMALVALGMAVSAATDSQVVAGIGSFVLFLMLFVLDWPAETVGGRMGEALKALSLPAHFEPFSKGMIASPDVVYYLSLTALGLFATRAIVASQRWR